MLTRASDQASGATVFAYPVKDPERYGVVELDSKAKSYRSRRNSVRPKSHYAVTGLYFYDNAVLDIAATMRPSPRGELEITDVNRVYLEPGNCGLKSSAEVSPGLTPGPWSRSSRPRTTWRPSNPGKGLKIACIEEVAYRMEYITATQVELLAPEASQRIWPLSPGLESVSLRTTRTIPCLWPESVCRA